MLAPPKISCLSFSKSVAFTLEFSVDIPSKNVGNENEKTC